MTEERQWHLDKRVNISHLLGTMGLALSMFMWASRMDVRVSVLETNQVQQKERDNMQDQALRTSQDEITRRLSAMDSKLDRLIERQIGGGRK